jgi:hypothetical protein
VFQVPPVIAKALLAMPTVANTEAPIITKRRFEEGFVSGLSIRLKGCSTNL